MYVLCCYVYVCMYVLVCYSAVGTYIHGLNQSQFLVSRICDDGDTAGFLERISLRSWNEFQGTAHRLLPSYHPIILSSYHPTILSSYHPIILSSYHPLIPSYLPTILPSYHPTILLPYHPTILSRAEGLRDWPLGTWLGATNS